MFSDGSCKEITTKSNLNKNQTNCLNNFSSKQTRRIAPPTPIASNKPSEVSKKQTVSCERISSLVRDVVKSSVGRLLANVSSTSSAGSSKEQPNSGQCLDSSKKSPRQRQQPLSRLTRHPQLSRSMDDESLLRQWLAPQLGQKQQRKQLPVPCGNDQKCRLARGLPAFQRTPSLQQRLSSAVQQGCASSFRDNRFLSSRKRCMPLRQSSFSGSSSRWLRGQQQKQQQQQQQRQHQKGALFSWALFSLVGILLSLLLSSSFQVSFGYPISSQIIDTFEPEVLFADNEIREPNELDDLGFSSATQIDDQQPIVYEPITIDQQVDENDNLIADDDENSLDSMTGSGSVEPEPLPVGEIIASEEEQRSNPSELEQQLDQLNSEDSFWVNRRRLDRDRALEPPTWLRDQPMRRASNGPLIPGDDTPPQPPMPDSWPDYSDSNGLEDGSLLRRRLAEVGVSESDPVIGIISEPPSGKPRVILLADFDLKVKGESDSEKDSENGDTNSQPTEEHESLLMIPNLMKRAPRLIEDELIQMTTTTKRRNEENDQSDEASAYLEAALADGDGGELREPIEISGLGPAGGLGKSLTQRRLATMVTKLKMRLEEMLELPKNSIVSLYPLEDQQTVLIKLNERLLDELTLERLPLNYDLTGGFMSAKWPLDSKENPIPLLRAILRAWVAPSSETLNKVFEHYETLFNRQANNAITDDGQEIKEETSSKVTLKRQFMDLASKAMYTTPSALFMGGSANPGISQVALDFLPDDDSSMRNFYLLATRGPDSMAITSNNYNIDQLWQAEEIAPSGRRYLARELYDASGGFGRGTPAAAILLATPSLAFAANQRSSTPLILGKGYHNERRLVNESFAENNRQTSASSLLQWTGAYGANSGKNNNALAMYILAMVALFAGTGLAVKMLMKRTGSIISLNEKEQTFRRKFARFGQQTSSSFKSIWSSGSISGEFGGGPSEPGQGLERANLTEGSQSDCLPSESSSKAKNLDVLAQRLVNLLKKRGPTRKQRRRRDSAAPTSGPRSNLVNQLDCSNRNSSINKLEEDDCEEGELVEEEEDYYDDSSSGHFRSSRSYIKSLIEVLSNARSQMAHSVPMPSFRSSVSTTMSCVDSIDASSDVHTNNNKLQQYQLEDDDDGGLQSIAVSQMDISAAHLILAYMERHLEDKERLKREWLELNGQSLSKKFNKVDLQNPIGSQNGIKVRQLTLQRFAKVALSEENRSKNRNLLVVPFDRNRVKLFTGLLASPNNTTTTTTSRSTPILSRPNSGKLSKSANSNRKGCFPKSDYINASYIYDDDLRRPTHIIAQGPLEQTAGQFWQMIWEQGISVIVMLTRLNENGQRACHCYWPTNVAETNNPSSDIQQQTATVVDLTSPTSPTSTTSGLDNAGSERRRGSVTSVFDALSGRHQAPTSASATSPASALGAGCNQMASSSEQMLPGSTSSSNLTTGRSSQQPIMGNGELSNNVLVYDINYESASESSASSSLEEETDELSILTKNDENDEKLIDKNEFQLIRQTKDKNKNKITNSNGKNNIKNKKVRFEIHLISEHVSSNDYLVRNMYIINRLTNETRTISQFHYLAWPKNGTPQNAKSLLAFRRKVHKSYRNLSSPILVHCSEGSGRSGTYALIDIILERIKNGAKEIDPRATLEHLRDQRVGLCSSQSQFEFVLVALAEEIQIILKALPR